MCTKIVDIRENKMTHHILYVNSLLAGLITDLAHAFVKIVDRVAHAAKVRANRRETFKQLSRLSDKELLDMGITRYDIEQIANSYK
jgi:uncharacterized protein YjiS (DUF1127 family)